MLNRLQLQTTDLKIDLHSPSAQPLKHAAEFILRWKYWSELFSKNGLATPKIILDVGACIGVFAIPFALAFPDAKVIAIEPAQNNFACLLQNTRPFKNISCLRVAAHDTNETIAIGPLDNADGNSGMMSVYGRASEKVEAYRLDSMFKAADLIKIDVEGHERAVIEGAADIIHNSRPVLLIENNDKMQKHAGLSASQIDFDLASIGYMRFIGMARGNVMYAPEAR